MTARAIITGDLGFGDAGKGSIVDYLTRQYQAHTVIRYNGGAQAAHNVVTPEGRHHTFAQFGSGTFIPGTKTYLSRFMMVDPVAMLKEARHLETLDVPDAFERTAVDRRALIITPFHQLTNRAKETARGDSRHGSCGMGIGETMSDFLIHGDRMLMAGDLCDRRTVIDKLRFIRDAKHAEIRSLPTNEYTEQFEDPELIDACADLYAHYAAHVQITDERYLENLLKTDGTVIFEAAQGVLLDENYGFQPYTTWSNITFDNALTLLEGYQGQVIRLGITRAYTPRHGAGPLVTEDAELSRLIPDNHNTTNPWQQHFRIGYFDAVLSRYAVKVMRQVDYLAVTNLDRPLPEYRICTAYRYPGEAAEAFFEGPLNDIRVIRPVDLVHQEALTGHLMRCQPVYEIEASQQDFLDKLEQQLHVPIALLSYGQTARDKKCLLPFTGA